MDEPCPRCGCIDLAFERSKVEPSRIDIVCRHCRHEIRQLAEAEDKPDVLHKRDSPSLASKSSSRCIGCGQPSWTAYCVQCAPSMVHYEPGMPGSRTKYSGNGSRNSDSVYLDYQPERAHRPSSDQ
jgi:hypothetical protein